MCSPAENDFLDAQQSTQNSSRDTQGQASQLNKQGQNYSNLATQYVPPSNEDPQKTQSPPAPDASSFKTLSYTPLEPFPRAFTGGQYISDFPQLLGVFFNVLLSIGAMVAIVTLVLGGITYMVSEIVNRKEEARQRMRAAVWGLLLLLGCWLLLNEINPGLVTGWNLPGLLDSGGSRVSENLAPNKSSSPADAANRACEKQDKHAHIGPDGSTVCQ